MSVERAFVRELEGGCQVPIGVYAEYIDQNLYLKAIVGLPDGSEIIEEHLQGKIALADIRAGENLGRTLAQRFIAKGARELLTRAQKMAFV